jgi:Nucleotide-diphospho-sugar transferase
MKLFCVVTPSHQVLYERFFLPSLDTNAFELHAHFLEQAGAGDFLADDFKNCIRFKLDKITESIQENPDAIVVWSDIDIQFFGLRPSHILSYFDSEEDFVGQRLSRSTEEVCGGFYAIRCSPKMDEFFNDVRELTRKETGGNEQDAMNLALKTSRIRLNWRLFGLEFYSRTQGVRIPFNAVLHHATCVSSKDYINQKVLLLARLQNFNHWSSLRKQLYVLQEVPGVLKRKLASLR